MTKSFKFFLLILLVSQIGISNVSATAHYREKNQTIISNDQIYKQLEKNFESVFVLNNLQIDAFKVKKNNKYGIIDKDGNVLIPVIHDKIKRSKINVNWFLIEALNKTTLVNIFGEEINTENYQIHGVYLNPDKKFESNFNKADFLIIQENQLSGLLDENLQRVFPSVVDGEIIGYKNGLVLAKKNKKIGLVDNSGKWVIDNVYDDIDWSSNGYVIAKNETPENNYAEKKYRYALLNTMGETIVPLSDNIIIDGNADIIVIKRQKGKYERGYAVIDTSGNTVVDFAMQIELLDNGSLLVNKEYYGLSEILNKNGKVLLESEYSILNHKSFLFVKNIATNQTGLLNHDLKTIFPIKFDSILPLSTNLVLLKRENLYCLINLERLPKKINHDDLEFDFVYQDVGKIGPHQGYIALKNGLLRLKKDNKWGAVNEEGDIVIDFNYDYMSGTIFEDANLGSLIHVTKDGKSGIINNNNQIIVSVKYDLDSKAGQEGFGMEFNKKVSQK